MKIAKSAAEPGNFCRSLYSFKNARSAFGEYMRALGIGQGDTVILPAYIGWSPNEGSGVHDPVVEAGARSVFYAVKASLDIDLDDVVAKLDSLRPKLLVLIHYFGFPDPHAEIVATEARKRGVLVLEDEAHAFFSDWVGDVCGRFGDASIFSLHKMFPFHDGGLLRLNRWHGDQIAGKLAGSSKRHPLENDPFQYDLYGISERRIQNARLLLKMINPLLGKVDPLYSSVPRGVVPQTLPVLIREKSRDELYFKLNSQGYGGVSLYHTMIERINAEEFPFSHKISKSIFNLPVHQDATEDSLTAMVGKMEQFFNE